MSEEAQDGAVPTGTQDGAVPTGTDGPREEDLDSSLSSEEEEREVALPKDIGTIRHRIVKGKMSKDVHEFRSIWEEIKSVKQASVQLELIRLLGTRLQSSVSPQMECGAIMADYLDSPEFRKSITDAGETFEQEEVADIYELRRCHREELKNRTANLAKIESNWPGTGWQKSLNLPDSLSVPVAKHLAALSNRISWEDVQELINKVVGLRLARCIKGRANGVGTTIGITNDDIELANTAVILGYDVPSLSTTFLTKARAQIQEDGCIGPADPVVAKLPPGVRLKEITDKALATEIEGLNTHRAKLQNERQKRKSKALPTGSPPKKKQKREKIAKEPDTERGTAEESEEPEAPPPGEAPCIENPDPTEEGENQIKFVSQMVNKPTDCQCPRGIPDSLKTSLEAPVSADWKVPMNLLKETQELKPKSLCFKHLVLLANHLHLRLSSQPETLLRDRTNKIWSKRRTLGDLLSNSPTFNWFLRRYRPWRKDDALGPLSRNPVNLPSINKKADKARIIQKMFELDAEDTLGVITEWKESGSANVCGLAAWASEPDVQEIIKKEMGIYEFHSRSANSGNLVLATHSLLHQALAMDPFLWLWTWALGTSEHRGVEMMAIFQPAIQLPPGGEYAIGFRENVNALQEGHGIHIHSLLIDTKVMTKTEESALHCIENLHDHFSTWYEDLLKRKTKITTLHTLQGDDNGLDLAELKALLPEANILKRPMEGTDNACTTATFNARIPWGIVPKPTETALVGRHQLVRITKDESGNPTQTEAGVTVAELIYANQAKLTTPYSKHRILNVKSRLRAPVPFIPTLPAPCPVSEALIGRRPWTDPEVITDANDWLTKGPADLRAKYQRWCQGIRKNLVSSGAKLTQNESTLYGENSYDQWDPTKPKPATERGLDTSGTLNKDQLNAWGATL